MARRGVDEAEQRRAVLTELLKLPENKECADCGAKGPKWASWSLGVFICIQCAGIHRSLGTHITKVKSATLDVWTDEQVANMRNMGNARAKQIFEHSVSPNYTRPREGAPTHVLENWIRAKYEKKQFMGSANRKEKAYEREYDTNRRQDRERERERERRREAREERDKREEKERSATNRVSSHQPIQETKAAKPLLQLEDDESTSVTASFNQMFVSDPSMSAASPYQQQPQQASNGSAFTWSNTGAGFGQQQQQQQQQQQHQQQHQQQNQGMGGRAAVDKQSIMSLYHQPIAPTQPLAVHQAASGVRVAPNYNVHLVTPTTAAAYMVYHNGVPMMVNGGAGVQMGTYMNAWQQPGQQPHFQGAAGSAPAVANHGMSSAGYVMYHTPNYN